MVEFETAIGAMIWKFVAGELIFRDKKGCEPKEHPQDKRSGR